VSRFEKGDHVVTPTGEEAVVIGEPAGFFVPLKYDGALDIRDAFLDLHEKFLRKYVPGLKMPKPVRVR